MARKNKLGEVRRSQVLSYGPGAVIDFRAGSKGGGPVSVVAPGLEFWDQYAKPAFPKNSQKISEPRLEKKLGVKGFRLPPVSLDDNENGDHPPVALPGFRFPIWLQCPICGTLKTASKWGKDEGDPSRWCNPCSDRQGRRVHAVPTRFVLACENGHLDEFPWDYWLKRDPGNQAKCKGSRYCSLKLRSGEGTGLSSLYLKCDECEAITGMGDIFADNALRGRACTAKTPWLEEDDVACSKLPRVLQRGASNLYFPMEVSALSIPPWSDAFQRALDADWYRLAEASDSELPQLVKILLDGSSEELGMGAEDICKEIIRRKKYLSNPEREDLKYDELSSFTGNSILKNYGKYKDADFQTTSQKVAAEVAPYITQSIRVDRLREVRALKGFTRINQALSSSDPGRAGFGKISSKDGLPWLPAVEMRGEGIFFSLNDNAIAAWSKQPEIVARVKKIDELHALEWKNITDGSVDSLKERPFSITAKRLLLHTLSHVIMRHISLECGYDTASVRERIYCDEGEKENNGVLIYTSSSDAEGTLGGLARMSEEDKFGPLILGAVAKAAWCSSDPLCIKGVASHSEDYNLAACHNCTLVPETSCEFYNRFLDRALLVGSQDGSFVGFFQAASL